MFSNLTVFDLPKFIVWNNKGLQNLVVKLRIENQSLWQKLNSFLTQFSLKTESFHSWKKKIPDFKIEKHIFELIHSIDRIWKIQNKVVFKNILKERDCTKYWIVLFWKSKIKFRNLRKFQLKVNIKYKKIVFCRDTF